MQFFVIHRYYTRFTDLYLFETVLSIRMVIELHLFTTCTIKKLIAYAIRHTRAKHIIQGWQVQQSNILN